VSAPSLYVSSKQLWVIFANLLGLLLLCWLVLNLQQLLWTVFVAFILSSTLLPAVEWLEKRKVPGWLAVLLPFVLLVVLLVLLVFPLTVLVLDQVQLLGKDLPTYWHSSQSQLSGLWSQFERLHTSLRQQNPFISQTLGDWPPDKLLAQGSGWALGFFGGLSAATLAASRSLTDGLSVILISLLMLLDRQGIVRFLLSFLPVSTHTTALDVLHKLARGVGSFVNSQVVLMAIGGVLTTMGLAAMHFPFALLFGVLTGLAFAIPLIGPTLIMIPAMVVAWLTPEGQGHVLWILLLYGGIQLVQNNIIGPILLSKTLGLHPLAIILAVMAGGVLAGIPGILLGIPVATCINVLMALRQKRLIQATIDF
jgi:predicted PurR-regulated permease PerM